MQKTLDQKLQRILTDSSCRDFILADAKDPDMAYGLAAPGRNRDGSFKTLQQFHQQIREIVKQGLVDIMLMSVRTSEVLTIQERLFDDTAITPAIRANDTTDIWLANCEGVYGAQPSRPFRTAMLEHAMFGSLEDMELREDGSLPGVDLGLYSVTLNNDVEADHHTLEAYANFREEAESLGFRHFLEVFSPNAPIHPVQDVPRFVNNHIVRMLAGVAGKGRPIFLKIPYYGPKAMEELTRYDSSLVVGILGGSAGTTFDAFHTIWESKKYGARVALYGRKINTADHQLSFIKHLRSVADGDAMPDDAVKAYHADLQKLGIEPSRSLEDDLQLTICHTQYGG